MKNLNDIKLIATDVDGTIVRDGTRELNPEYFDVFRALLDKGIQVVIASGRQFPALRDFFAPVGDRLWFIAEGGGVYRCGGENHTIDAIPIPYIKELIEDLTKLPDVDVMFSAPERAYTLTDTSEMYGWLTRGYGYTIVPLNGGMPEDPIVKIAMYHPVDASGMLPQSVRKKWEGRLHMTGAGDQWVDFTMPGVDKGVAIRRLMEYAGIQKENVLVFGDNQNDIEMLRAAGISCAVSNASEQMRNAATDIVPPYWEDGVLQVLKRLL